MALIQSYVKRAVDTDGSKILTYQDESENEIQAVVIVDADGNQIVPITDDQLIAALDDYGTNDLDEASATIAYVGKEKSDGTWMVMKLDTSSGMSIRYATVANNAAITTYAAAWAARAGLTYGIFAEAL
jgi:hypothetical protein